MCYLLIMRLIYLQKHHEQAQDELAYAVPKSPESTHQGGLDVAPAYGQWRERLRQRCSIQS